MILVIDNYDSFTFNLVQFLGELGADLQVYRNDALTVDEVKRLAPEKIIISPGPCTPNEAGISMDVIREMGPTTPVLGVCLGHQAIGQVYGGKVCRAPYLMHGKVSQVFHKGEGLFAGLPAPMTATRYHSLIVDRETLPADLEITAETDDGLIMGMKHKEHPVYGVQFHPESILTRGGKELLGNFLAL
ncbi:MAG TPA: aminodeoxychorismate/anthranilate synthase component II [Symbiobacteriaceae bacterium]|nr:aminodeoxychorismate/anthranilate synthase component II [Symbiobacteriaceae bacterium]